MNKQEYTFFTVKKDGVVQQIGKSIIEQPKVTFTTGKQQIKWFDDTKLIRKK